MPAQEPGISIGVRLGMEMANAMDAKVEQLAAETGNPHSRADVVRMALALYLGLIESKKNGTTPPAAT